MTQQDERDREMAALRDRLSRLSEASLRINESLHLDEVLQGVLDSARALTGARYALITTLDEMGAVDDHLVAGTTVDETRRIWEMPGGWQFFEYLNALSEPLRVEDFARHAMALGLPEFRPPVPTSAFLVVPIRHRGVSVGTIHVAKGEPGEAFSREDEETLVMFASQVALVVTNARRHREEQRARADVETLIDTSPVGVVVFDMRRGARVSFNREARRIVDELRDANQTTENLLELMTVRRADGRAVSLEEFPLAEALSAGETVRAEEIALEVADGRSITVLLNATPIRSEVGEIESVVVTIQDLTPLEEMERLRAEFLGMVSHELRTPLTSIRGSATTLLDAASDLDPAEMRQFHRIIVDQADHMRDLIGDLLDVARIETGTLPVDQEPVDVAALVDRARSVFQSSGGRDSLDIDLEPGLPPVMADRRRIVQVIVNLLTNASRHSPESSVIRVRAARDGAQVEVAVVDEGRGIPAERLPHLFRNFSRGEAADDPGGDTGLGLAICRGIVEAHGGRIRAESDGPGLGARFAFTLPTAEDLAAQLIRPSGATRPDDAEGEPILVVDDDPQMLRYVRRALSGAGYQPVVTADPGEALTLVEQRHPHLVLLDLMLPGTDGMELMGDILSATDVPVVFLSAYGRDEMVARALDQGATDYIVKPFSPTELVARVRAALRRNVGHSQPGATEPYVLGDLTIDYGQRLVTVAGRPVRTTATEYKILSELSLNAGQAVPHDQLLRRIWGANRPSDLRALRTHLRRLRRKLGDDGNNPTYLFSEPKVGYRMPRADGPQDGDA